jgi:hypothetical protein
VLGGATGGKVGLFMTIYEKSRNHPKPGGKLDISPRLRLRYNRRVDLTNKLDITPTKTFFKLFLAMSVLHQFVYPLG